MPAVLLESGSIINREEELVMASDEHKNKVATAVSSAAVEYCESHGHHAPMQVAKPAPGAPKAATRTAQPAKGSKPGPKLAAQTAKPGATRSSSKR
jgi:hypothetical protein